MKLIHAFKLYFGTSIGACPHAALHCLHWIVIVWCRWSCCVADVDDCNVMVGWSYPVMEFTYYYTFDFCLISFHLIQSPIVKVKNNIIQDVSDSSCRCILTSCWRHQYLNSRNDLAYSSRHHTSSYEDSYLSQLIAWIIGPWFLSPHFFPCFFPILVLWLLVVHAIGTSPNNWIECTKREDEMFSELLIKR